MGHVYAFCLCVLAIRSTEAFLWGGPKPGSVLSTVDDREVNKQLEKLFKSNPKRTFRSVALATAVSAGNGIEHPVYSLAGGQLVGDLAVSVKEGQTGLGLFAV